MIHWYVWTEIDASDPSVGIYGSELTEDRSFISLTDAIRHIVHTLVDRRLDLAIENEALSIEAEDAAL
jgi:hypothetical protein